MNYALFVQILVILFVGMRIGVSLYERMFDFDFYTDLIIVILWIYIIMKNN